MIGHPYADQAHAPFVLPDLPYAPDALAPHMSTQTFSLHHGKHHNAYVTNLNKLIEGTPLADKNLETIITTSYGDSTLTAVFNNAAQVWNHSFFWHCMKPKGGGKPTGALYDRIVKDFGSYDAFLDAMKQAGATQFGSGWAWLVWDNNALKVTKTSNADMPLPHGHIPLLTVDVWEHAYYVDYQNRRPDFLTTFFNSLVNWDFVAENFGRISR